MSTPTTLASLTLLSTTTQGPCGCGCGCDDPLRSVAVTLPSATETALDTRAEHAVRDREHEA